ncbi:CHAT domain-containing protein [Actinomadura soli]|uniref:CHAT domain-containing protein n=1 Tax=Actinomadura soli TaxID=2508997 RepID=A0A5C4JK86_9ACTN|nr:CHAT domain-containing protein [Actinomadura soli]TMR07014.1 CHAT domain-containing protein [Actinomadura soli]
MTFRRWVEGAGSVARTLRAEAGLWRAQSDDDPAVLDAVVQHLREALDNAPHNPDGIFGRPHMLSDLCFALRLRFERGGAVEDIDGAVAAGEQALGEAFSGHLARSAILANLSAALLSRHGRRGGGADLNRGVELAELAVESTPAGNGERPKYLSNLGSALRSRFEETGVRADLDRAVELERQAIEAFPADSPFRPGVLANLGAALSARFDLYGDPADLTGAVDALRQAVDAAPPRHPNRPGDMSSLSGVHLSRYEYRRTAGPGGASDDLDRAVHYASSAVTATPAGHPERPGRLGNLGNALLARYEAHENPEDITAAEAVVKEALELADAEIPDHSALLDCLGGVLAYRHLVFDSSADLDRAIEVTRRSVDRLPSGHPGQAARRWNLASLLIHRSQRTRDSRDVREVLVQLRAAATSPTAAVGVRIRAARRWGAVAASLGDRWATAAEGYAELISLLPLLAWRGLDTPRKGELLAEFAWVAAEAAACAVQAGDPRRALRLLEQGRGVQWAQLLELRSDLSMIEAADPGLAAEMVSVRDALDRVEVGAAVEGGAAWLPRITDERLRLAQRWDELLARARELLGAGFLNAPDVADLQHAAGGGPVVVVNASVWGSHALIVTADDVRAVPLPELSEDAVVENANRFMATINAFDQRGLAEFPGLEQAIADILGWLWDAAAEPVLAELGHTGAPAGDWPRVWWCPTGPLTVLPLHAAGRHHLDGESVLDRVVSSYLPTLRSAAPAPPAGGERPAPRVLHLAVPGPAGYPPVTGLRKDRELLAELLPEGSVTPLYDPDVEPDAVYKASRTHSVLHFSGHATQDIAHPHRGGLLVGDSILTVPRLSAGHPGELAFLAACRTALGGVLIPDEVVTIAAAFNHAGWRHVIGTLWPVGGRVAAKIAAGVYPRIVTDGRVHPDRTALALHLAVRHHRARRTDRPSQWAAFVHLGDHGAGRR